jgi:Cu/Ag efflux protein CusF
VGLLTFVCLAALAFAASQKHDISGLLLAVDPAHHTITVSCKEIPGYMEAMTMSFRIKDQTLPADLQPGVMVDFTLVVDNDTSFAEGVHIRLFESLELDPTEVSSPQTGRECVERASALRRCAAHRRFRAGFSPDRPEP